MTIRPMTEADLHKSTLTARERAEATFNFTKVGRSHVESIEAAIHLATHDEALACAAIADAAAMQRMDLTTARVGDVLDACATIAARIRERAKRWPDPGATT